MPHRSTAGSIVFAVDQVTIHYLRYVTGLQTSGGVNR